MIGYGEPQAIGGKLLARPMKTLLAIFAVSLGVMWYRFSAGLGPVSNMTDGFTWGIWEPVNVVVFTGIGAGAYGVGLLCYLLNKGRYHGLVRPAVLAGAICYSLGAASIVVALGRYWNSYWLGVPTLWNLSSALLEVAICVLTYVMVLWVEMLPSFLARISASPSARWKTFGKKWGGRLQQAMPYIIALAILLPTMHQSSLGGLLLIAGPKIHPLWHTALLPTLFLISCLSMGFGAVVVLITILKLTWNVEHDQRLLAEMSRVNAYLLIALVVLRIGDITAGKLWYVGWDLISLLFFVELALFLTPALLFLSHRVKRSRGRLFGASLLAVAAGAVYRVDAYLSVYRPAPGWNYWPSIGEMTVTVGMAALGIAVFILISRMFPVLVVEETATGRPRASESAASR